MFHKNIVMLMVSASLAATSTAYSQDVVHLGIGGGVSIPAGTFRDTYSPKENVLLTLAAGPQDSPLGIRLDYSYNEFGSRHVLTGGDQGTHLNIATANLIAVIPGEIIKPYIIGGGGLYRFQEGTDLTTSNHFGLNAGLGCTFPLFSEVGFIEARYHRIYGRTVSEQLVPVTLGILF